MSRTSFVSRLRDQVVRPLIHSALVEREIADVTVAVVVGSEFYNSLHDPWDKPWTYPEDGHEYIWAYVTYLPTNERSGWRLGRSEDLHDPAELVNALWQLGSDFEDWVCETSFAWGEERHARVPEIRDLPGWITTGA